MPEARGRRGRVAWRERSLTALLAGALVVDLALLAALLLLLIHFGVGYFIQSPVTLLTLEDGTRVLGEVRASLPQASTRPPELQLAVGNRELYGQGFRWVAPAEIVETDHPANVAWLERRSGGPFVGFPLRILRQPPLDSRREAADDVARRPALLADGAELWPMLDELLAAKRAERSAIEAFERDVIQPLDVALSQTAATTRHDSSRSELEALLRDRLAEREALDRALRSERLSVRTAEGLEVAIPVSEIVRAVRPNTLGVAAQIGLALDRWTEFLLGAPRESNTEGGILPAIFGTALMVFLTSLAVAPLGVLTALYLAEYARPGPVVRMIRIAVYSLAGIPSIVIGVFGLGFFVYGVGGQIDAWLFADALPAPTFGTGGILWASLTLALLTVPVVVVATEDGLAAVPPSVRSGSVALGATRLQTLCRLVLPGALPGILTGLILAMARAAGEVAPLMIVGMVKLAPTLPLDGEFPFLHLERKFMHLGFHIYDLGFQSPNVEAALPLVFATTLLLVGIVLATNLASILLRGHLHRRYANHGV